MDCPAPSPRSGFPLFLLGVLLALPLPVAADDPWTVYDPDPQHPWNRVFRALYDMTPSESGSGQNAEFNARWPENLLHGARHRQVISALDDYLNKRADRLFRDPVKRALFQNDLWKLFNWTLKGGRTDDQAARIALQTRLVRIMRRVALTRFEISQLPDTYASSVRSRAHPVRYDPARRQRTFLPPDLWNEKGPWVLLGNNHQQKPAAILHARQLGATSDFFVFLSLPDGRDRAKRFLQQNRLLDYSQIQSDLTYLKRQQRLPDFVPTLPPLPEKPFEAWWKSFDQNMAGTRVALVRQMRVLSASGYDYPTRIIERVQIRVYRNPALPPQFPPAPEDTRFRRTTFPFSQDVHMFRLDRKALADGKPNSLRPVSIHEYTRNSNFINGNPLPDEIRPAGQRPALRNFAERILDSCASCHSPPGLFSFMTFSRAFTVGEQIPRLHEQKRDHEEGMGRSLNARALGYLQALWNTVPD